MDAYLAEAGISSEKKTPLFRSVDKKKQLTENPLSRNDVLRMIKRRAKAAGLPYSTCCHIPFGRQGSPPTPRTAGRSKTPSQSRFVRGSRVLLTA